MVTAQSRTVSFQSEGLALEGLLHLPTAHPEPPEAQRRASRRAAVVVCHPHPQYGGDMHNNVVSTICDAALGLGFAALRFNFRGVGASQGEFDNAEGEQHDAAAALDYLRSLPEIEPGRLALAGYSFGALVALRFASGRDDLAAVISVSNPTQRGPHVSIHLRAPTLFVTGDEDEYCDGALLAEYRTQLGEDVTVEVIPGIDHFWQGHERQLAETVGDFLTRHLSSPA